MKQQYSYGKPDKRHVKVKRKKKI